MKSSLARRSTRRSRAVPQTNDITPGQATTRAPRKSWPPQLPGAQAMPAPARECGHAVDGAAAVEAALTELAREHVHPNPFGGGRKAVPGGRVQGDHAGALRPVFKPSALSASGVSGRFTRPPSRTWANQARMAVLASGCALPRHEQTRVVRDQVGVRRSQRFLRPNKLWSKHRPLSRLDSSDQCLPGTGDSRRRQWCEPSIQKLICLSQYLREQDGKCQHDGYV